MFQPNNLQSFANQLQNLMRNPQKIMSEQMGIPADVGSNPTKAIQYLMDSGKITQQQFNQAKNAANMMQSNPIFMQMFKR